MEAFTHALSKDVLCLDSLSDVLAAQDWLLQIFPLLDEESGSISIASLLEGLDQMVVSIQHKVESRSEVEYLFLLVDSLHSLLLAVERDTSAFSKLKSSISQVCQQWWLRKLPKAEFLMPQLLPYLLMVSLEPDASQADVKRVYMLREAFHLFDFHDESMESILDLLMRAMISPIYLKVFWTTKSSRDAECCYIYRQLKGRNFSFGF